MKTILNVKGKSQFDEDVEQSIRSSACGPVTAFVMTQHLFPQGCPYTTNELYRLLGSTKIGLFKYRFIRNMRKMLGVEWTVAGCTIDEVKRQLDNGRPVAAKFDKWFTFRWRGKYGFDYHWVPVIGYEETADDIYLFIHDNGGRNRDSQVRHISYKKNRSILSFIKIEPTE
ncbi:C39 family peptidase [Sporosarcina sp. FSL K6-6792]|uniref:C39 family peptidase n=1 Tax=Sporosarcina sp. FSL K6-6792 TaxID=2921559 RepID=UPI0030F4BBAF